jgi:monoamine oxidase
LGSKPGISDAKSALDSVYPFALGGYASAKTGQYTTLLELAAEPALHGRLQFAGEHTSTDFLGFMNGGVQSGNRAAATLIKSPALHR